MAGRSRRRVARGFRNWSLALGATTAGFLAVTGIWLVVGHEASKPAATRVIVARAADPSAVAILSNGGFRYAERRSGRIREVDAQGRLRPRAVATVPLRSMPGQRGLLGLAIDRRGETFAAWTRRSDGRLVVGQVAPGPVRLVWEGPVSADLANGGRLAFTPDGGLLIGIGDLERPARTLDPAAPNGKLLLLDPRAEPTQPPRTLSSGWNNPFAFAYTSGSELWVADNAPGRRPERITRGDLPKAPVTTTGSLRPLAPSALIGLPHGRLGLCGYVDRTMREVRVDGNRATQPGRVLVAGCAIAAAVLPDGRVVVTDDDTIRITVDRVG